MFLLLLVLGVLGVVCVVVFVFRVLVCVGMGCGGFWGC